MNRISSASRASLIRLASSLPKGDKDRRTILAGLKTAIMQDSRFWDLIDRYRGPLPSTKRAAVTRSIMEEFAEEHGRDVSAWKAFAASFEEAMFRHAMVVKDALHEHYDQIPDGPSDSSLRRAAYSIVMLGKQAAIQAVSKPESLPRHLNFKWSGGFKPLSNLLSSKHAISEDADLMWPYDSHAWKWPRGWK